MMFRSHYTNTKCNERFLKHFYWFSQQNYTCNTNHREYFPMSKVGCSHLKAVRCRPLSASLMKPSYFVEENHVTSYVIGCTRNLFSAL
jgi:hypothetical protein